MIDIFFHIFPQLILLYSLILVGFLFGKFNNVSGLDISKTLIYFVTPILIFHASYNVKLSLEVLIIPLVIICLMAIMQYISFIIFKQMNIKDSNRFILTFISTSKNCGYLGIPIASLIFETDILNMYILTILGYALYQSVFAIYFMSYSKFNIKDSFKKLLIVPMLYASLLGFSLNYFDISLPQILIDFRTNIYNTYFIFGMIIIGFGFAKFEKCEFSKQFIIIPLILQSIVWPLLVILLIYIDNMFFSYFSLYFHKIFLLFSILPVGANIVVFSYVFTDKVSKTSFVVLLSTTLSLVYIPFMLWYLDIVNI